MRKNNPLDITRLKMNKLKVSIQDGCMLRREKKGGILSILKLNLFLLIFINSFSVFAQSGVLSGFVKLTEGSPVAYAVVSLYPDTIQALTNEKGYFEFKNISNGAYVLKVSSIEVNTQSFNINYKGEKNHHHFTVSPADGLLTQEVVVQAKTAKKDIETKGFAVNVIEPHIEARQSIQTNELLDRAAGVRIRQDGGLGSRISYNLNGLSGNAVRVFINGVPASNYGHSFSANSIPPALIERIEVYKGVVPAYLSEDALGGAINIVLKNKSRNSFVTSYSGGSFNTHQWNAAGSYRTQKGFSTNLSTFFNYSDNSYKVWGKNISFKDYTGQVFPNQKVKRFHDAYMSYGVKGELGFTDVKWADRFMIGGIFSKDYKEVQHGITMDLVYGDRHTRRTSNVATINYLKQDFLTKGLSVKADASYSYIKRQAIDTVGRMYDWSGNALQYPDGSYVLYNSGAEVASQKTLAINSDKTFLTRINLGYKIGLNNGLYFNYLHNTFIRGISDELQAKGLQMLENTRDLQKNIVSFTYENIAFNNKVKTNLFYKAYIQKAISNEPYKKEVVQNEPVYDVKILTNRVNFSGYGATISYEIISNLYFLSSYERAIRLPSPDEIFGNLNDNLLAPAQPLQPETSHNLNVGFNWSHDFNSHFVKVNSSVFYRNTKGMIREAIKTGSFTYSSFENLESVVSRGIDVELTYKFKKQLHLFLNVSKFASLFNTQYDINGAPYLFYRMQIRNEPSFKLNFNAAYNFHDLFAKNAKASIYYNMNFVQKFLRNWANMGGQNLDYIPTQWTHDLGVSYTIPSDKITLSVDAKNISNQQVFDNFGLQKPGRAFYAKITFSLNSK
ncbi:MAG: TonB-dependent receptor [Chitinophagales bacterium]|nr:TonB-dependent receptor [Chitinophagales bacterium]